MDSNPTTDSHQPHPADADEQAADWLLALQNSTDKPALQQQISAWLALSEQHQQAWQRVCKAWHLLGDIQPDSRHWPEAQPQPFMVRLQQRCRQAKTVIPLALAACLMVTLWPVLQLYIMADHMTGRAETRQITLQDGSLVYLGADSAISTDYQTGQRRVTLLSGEAFFQVVHNPQRPFVVTADNVEVTVLGTRFDVENNDHQALVGVESGLVSVRTPTTAQHITPGQQLSIDADSGKAQVQTIPQHNIASWREGHLFVRNRSIGAMAETLQRYYHGIILVADRQLAEKTITGSYQLQDVDRALQAMVKPYGGRVIEVTPLLRILVSS